MRRSPPHIDTDADQDESGGKVTRIVLEANRGLKGDAIRKGIGPGKGIGNESRKGKGARGVVLFLTKVHGASCSGLQ